MKKVNELSGATILYKRANNGDVLEGTVKRLSEDGKYVKLDDSGKWYLATDISVLEVLSEAPAKKAPKSAAKDPIPAKDPAANGAGAGN